MRCPVCSSSKTNVLYPKITSVYSSKPYSIEHCDSCNHFFTSPAPKATELNLIYKNKYSYDAHALIESEKRMRAKNYARYIATLRQRKNILEVGCMHGLLLTELKKLGVAASGIELDPKAVDYCKKHGLDVSKETLEDHIKKSKKQYDLVIMSHVLEHIADPSAQLKKLHKKLAPGGKLLIIVPNSMAKTRKVFGPYWGYWQVPVHINHFNAQSLEKLLSNAGFRRKDLRYFGGDSLFFLSSLANRVGAVNASKKLSRPRQLVVRVMTLVLRPWYKVGKEDMLMLAAKKT